MEQLAGFEYGAFVAASPILRYLGRGDRHPVLVLPGFTASDRTTRPLRSVLRGQGYWAHGWRLGANMGPHPQLVEGMRRRLDELHSRHGVKVSLIGLSLGGIYARELARDHPDSVRQVIMLGSPFRFREGDRGFASPLYDRLGPRSEAFPGRAQLEENRPPLPVPATAIYSRSDGIVRWHACIEAEGPLRENIEVRGTHGGLGYNPAVVIAVANRLAQPEGKWAPFRPPWGTAHLFPAPAVWHARPGTETVSAPEVP
jgi:pimeloyl-ACP methyl ester carboxylesterase